MFGLGHWEILLLVAIVLIFFVGPKKLPDFGRSLGKSIRDFKKALKDEETLDVTDSAKAEKIEGNSSNSSQSKAKQSEKERS